MLVTGIGYDMHRLVADRPLVLGGVCLDHPLGLDGHSDADVVTHAIIDALLGATAGGSIGTLFPDTDPRWKGARSIDLLAAVVERLRAARAAVRHVDVTVIAERPRVAPHAAALRAALAPILGIPLARVSIKGTTAEGMGALGREEGIAALAVATVDVEDASA
jgi:2-C-methyl-D-erythritol 2,4-cyclodiphosphate synthase